jgi:DNA polymerase phi
MPKEGTVAVDDESWISKVLATISALDKDRKHLMSLSEANEEKQPLVEQAHKTIENLKQVRCAQLAFYYIHRTNIRLRVR